MVQRFWCVYFTMQTHVFKLHAYASITICTHARTAKLAPESLKLITKHGFVCVLACVCVNVYMCVHACVCVCVCVCMRACAALGR